MEPDNTSPARERATSPPPAALRFQESVASPSASASSPTQSNAFSTPPRPILLQGSFGRTAGQASGGSKGRLIELREPERARVAGRERTNVLSTTNLHPQLGPHAGIEGEASSRATGGSVSFRGLGPGETRLDVPSAAAPGGPSQDAPQQSTPGSAHYTAQGLPLFAEQFSTPLRRRKRANSSSASAAATTLTSPLAARVPTPPNEDDSTDDLYRGPLPPPEAPQRRTFRFDTSGRQLDEDAVSLRSMSTSDSASTKSSSSSSSRASVVSFVVGAFEAVGRGLGVLSSASSGSSSSSSSDSDSDAGRRPWHRRRSRRRSSTSTVRGSARVDLEAGASTAGKRRSKHNSRKKKRTRRRMRRLRRLRAFSFAGSASGTSRRGSSSSGSSGSSSSSSSSSGSNSSSSSSSSDDEPLGRRKVLGTREFRLMLPPERAQDKPSPTYLSPPIPGGLGDLPIPIHDQDQDGMIVTQSLDEIVMSINRLRSAEFHIPTPPPPQAFSQPVPPIVSVPQPLSTTIQIPPTAFDASRPLTPSQVLNIAPPSPSTTLPIFSGGPLSPHPSAVPSRLLEPKQQFPVSPDRTPPGSRSSSLRREVRLPLPEVRIDGPTPLPSPMGEKSEYEASLGNGEGTGLKAPLKPAWWLDVSCPTWEDMRSLGELLSLHPLTLEDILQQEPREKLEVFDALDYYLISFRALDESYFRYTDDGATGTAADTSGLRGRRKGRGKVEIVEDRPGKEGLEGVGVGGISLYIVVMRDGVVSFHFEDVKKHVASVTQRVQGLEPGFHLSSDWIAHMFMDSMVDVFMPLIDFIEDEADEIDSRIVHHDTQGSSPLAALADAEDAFVQEERRRLSEEEAEREKAAARASSASGDGSSGSSDDFVRKQKEAGLEAHELQSHPRRPSSARADDSSPCQDLSTRTTLAAWIQGQSHWFKIEKGDFIFVRRTVLAFYPLIARTLIILSLHPAQRQARKLRREAKRGPKLNLHDFDRKLMLKRMVGMRRLVTGLNRLLVTKNEVVGRLRKRAADMRRSSPRSATDLSEQMSTYFGDIQDHILSMQQTLAYCEHVLASSQPAYLSQLGIASRSARNGTQSSILALSFVTIGVLPLQIVLGVNSVNVNLPHNGDPENKLPGYPFNVWGIVIVACFVLAVLYILLIRYWKRVAKARSNERRQIFI